MIISFLEQYEKYKDRPDFSFWHGYTSSIDTNEYWRFDFGRAEKKFKLGLLRGQPMIFRLSDKKVIARTLRCEDLSIIYGFLAILNGRHFPELCEIKRWKRHFNKSSERLEAIRAIALNRKHGIYMARNEVKANSEKTDDEFRADMKRIGAKYPELARTLTYKRLKEKHQAERFKYSYEQYMLHKRKR